MNNTIIKEKIKAKYDEIKNTTFINGTGGYGDNFKKKVIEDFNLDLEYANMVKRISFGDIMNITKNLKNN